MMLEKEDEMDCLVAGCNFLLKAIYHEAFSFEGGGPNYVTPRCAPCPRPAILSRHPPPALSPPRSCHGLTAAVQTLSCLRAARASRAASGQGEANSANCRGSGW